MIPANTYGTVIAAINRPAEKTDVTVGVSAVMRLNWTMTESGIAIAARSAESDRMVARRSGASRARLKYTQTAPAVMRSFEPTSAAAYVVGACALVIFVRSFAVPAAAKIVIAEIAGTSMFIYLTHYQVISVMNRIFGEPMPWTSFLVSLVVGVVTARVYTWLERKTLQILRRQPGNHPGNMIHN